MITLQLTDTLAEQFQNWLASVEEETVIPEKRYLAKPAKDMLNLVYHARSVQQVPTSQTKAA